MTDRRLGSVVDMDEAPVISVRHLTKRYADFVAVNDISFEVQPGEIFGIVGPNGAGKTSAIESVMGLRWPYAGEVRVLGLDPHRQRTQLAERIGMQLQQAELPRRLKVRELLDLFASFYQHAVPYEPLLKARPASSGGCATAGAASTVAAAARTSGRMRGSSLAITVAPRPRCAGGSR